MSSFSVCNHSRDKQIELPQRGRFCYHLCDNRPNWTPLSPIAITKHEILAVVVRVPSSDNAQVGHFTTATPKTTFYILPSNFAAM